MVAAVLAGVGPSQPSGLQIWLPAALSAIAVVVAAYMTFRSSRRANLTTERISLSEQQVAWTQQAMTEAHAAKAEAKQALNAAGVAESAAPAATSAGEAGAPGAAGAGGRWQEGPWGRDSVRRGVAGVVPRAHADGIGDGAAPAVLELLRVINGGPPEVTSAPPSRRRGGGAGRDAAPRAP